MYPPDPRSSVVRAGKLIMTQRLELALLGSPVVRLGGTPVIGFRSAKTQALLYYLAATRRPQPRSTLAGLFWAGVGDYYARRNLNRTLSNLIQLVGDHLIKARETLALDRSQPYWLDSELLDHAVNTAATTADPESLQQALNLYRGEFLAGFYIHDAPEFEQWVLAERTRLNERYMQGLQTLAQLLAGRGDLTGASTAVRRALQLEPWREEAHRQLMLLLAQSGQRNAALAQFELCRQALATELAVEPEAATLELVARIRSGAFEQEPAPKNSREETTLHPPPPTPHAPPESPPHTLPLYPTPFLGRETELAEIARLLDDADCRLLTLVGPGGMGKTRLAVETAKRIVQTHVQHGKFSQGVFFVPLEAVQAGDNIVSAIISVIADESGFPLHAAAPLQQQLLAYLRDKAILLLLDNFEHLVAAAGLLSAILQAAPAVKLLVTSREAIGLQEAWYYPTGGMSLPETAPDELSAGVEADAVRFFVQCARRTQPGFTLAAERAAVLHICQMVEGMPLAIELAAAWLKALTPQQIVRELERGLDILTTRFQNIPARHRSIRVVLDHSWSLLEAEERAVAERLSVFLGSFQPAAAAEVAGASLLTLAVLAEKALLRVHPDRRYQLHELTRQYAAERLPGAATSALRDTHATYYATLVAQQRPYLFTDAYQQALATLAAEYDNILHAWHWIIDAIRQGSDGLPVTVLLRQMAEVLATYYLSRSLWLAGQALFSQAAQVMEAAGWSASGVDQPSQRERQAMWVHIRLYIGVFHFEMGQFRLSLALAEELLELCRALTLEHDLVLALLLYGRTQMRRGIADAANAALEEALAESKRLGLTAATAEAVISLGLTASNIGHYAQARTYFEQVVAFGQKSGYQPWSSRGLTNLGTTYSRQHDYERARPYYAQSLAIALEEGNRVQIMINTSNLGGVERGFGHFQLSESYYKQSLALAQSLSDKRWIAANLNGIAITYLEMGNLASAEHALRQALTVASRNESTPDTLGSVALLGHVLARRGQIEAALRALAFVEEHPSVMARDRLYNEPLLVELRSELPANHFAEAAAWATSHSLEEVVQWLETLPWPQEGWLPSPPSSSIPQREPS
jgi:predicted ATPase/DNA-binding SARP family transcriptional activator/Tfp pilus assembly protein PilF